MIETLSYLKIDEDKNRERKTYSKTENTERVRKYISYNLSSYEFLSLSAPRYEFRIAY